MRKIPKGSKKIKKNSGPLKMPRIQKNFHVPEKILESLDECTQGGFILITADENGEPKIYNNFDGAVQALGFITFCREHFDVLDDQIRQGIRMNTAGGSREKREEEGESDEEGDLEQE